MTDAAHCRMAKHTQRNYDGGIEVRQPYTTTQTLPVPSGLSLRPERIWFRFLSFLFVFFSFLFICVSFLCTLLLVCFSGVRVICVTDMFLVLRISLRVIRDGVPQLASTVPLSTGTAVHVLFCFLPSRGFSYCRLACDHGLDFREMSY